ncbi:hypothetical protein [Anaeromyxobacter sp. SG66]|uniref:hypothetical protein n=1 Tax=Anaeromyxobacter sp. SG66 TaxID=2925410 RepID=UPI001F58009A|nr:hypothetical protein [Anaeromyxobacter sp. SG66]
MTPISLAVAAALVAATPRAPSTLDPAPARAGPADAAAAADAEALRALAVLSSGEPAIAEVQAAAAQAADSEAPGAVGFARRARLAALLPRLTAEYQRDERSHRVVGLQGSGEVDYLRLAPGFAVTLRATWDLGGLVAATGEVAAAAEATARARARAEAVKRATTLYYERQRLRLSLLLDPPGSALTRAQAELEIDRLGAELAAIAGARGVRGRP